MHEHVEREWERLELRWLAGLLEPRRKPSVDPVHEMTAGVVQFRHALKWIGQRPACARMDISRAAWDVICRSPFIFQRVGTPDPGQSLSSYLNQFMGIPVVHDDQLPEGVIVFRDSSGSPLRLVYLTDLPIRPE